MTMRNLYSRLFKYQATESRTQLENFCTESLCDLLNRLDTYEQNKFFIKLALPNVPNKKVHWETQVVIHINNTHKFPDLVGYVDGQVHYLIEVKIDADFTQDIDGDGNVKSQLEVYDRWLATQPNQPSLILLTYNTEAIEGFDDLSSNKFLIQSRKSIYWQQIYESFPTDNELPLLNDFKAFLKERNLAMDTPTKHDFDVLELYMSGALLRVEYLMGIVNRKVMDRYQGRVTSKPKYSLEGGCLWSWAYFTEEQFFHWGFYYPNLDKEWHLPTEFPDLPSDPMFIFGGCVEGVNQDNLSIEMLSRFKASGYNTSIYTPKETDKEHNIFMQYKPLAKLLDGTIEANDLANWVCSEIDKALTIING